LTFISIRKYYILEILFPINIYFLNYKKQNIKKKRKMDFTREDWSPFTKNMTFKYKEYEMVVDGVHNDVVITVNANEEIKIIECQVRV